MIEKSIVLHLDPKPRVHSVVYRSNKKDNPFLGSVYVFKESLFEMCKDIPKEITLTISAE